MRFTIISTITIFFFSSCANQKFTQTNSNEVYATSADFKLVILPEEKLEAPKIVIAKNFQQKTKAGDNQVSLNQTSNTSIVNSNLYCQQGYSNFGNCYRQNNEFNRLGGCHNCASFGSYNYLSGTNNSFGCNYCCGNSQMFGYYMGNNYYTGTNYSNGFGNSNSGNFFWQGAQRKQSNFHTPPQGIKRVRGTISSSTPGQNAGINANFNSHLASQFILPSFTKFETKINPTNLPTKYADQPAIFEKTPTNNVVISNTNDNRTTDNPEKAIEYKPVIYTESQPIPTSAPSTGAMSTFNNQNTSATQPSAAKTEESVPTFTNYTPNQYAPEQIEPPASAPRQSNSSYDYRPRGTSKSFDQSYNNTNNNSSAPQQNYQNNSQPAHAPSSSQGSSAPSAPSAPSSPPSNGGGSGSPKTMSRPR